MAAALLAVAVCAAPLLCGSARPWAIAPLLSIALGACLASGRGRRGVRLDPVLLAGMALLAATVLQAVPLPAALVKLLSPVTYEIQRGALGPLGATDAGWRTLSLAPASTWLEASKIALLLLVYAAARDVATAAGRSSVARMVAGAGVLVAATGFLHALVGAEAVWGVVRPDGVGRIAGPFVNGNHQAGLLVLGASAALGLALEATSPRARWAWASAGVAAVGAGVLTRSRGGTVAIALAVGGAIALGVFRHSGARRWFPAAALAAMLAVVAVWGDVLVEVFSDTNTLKMDIWRPTPDYFRDFWATGAGRGAFQVVYTRYQRLPDVRTFTHAENVPLQTLLDHGVLGGVLVLGSAAGLIGLLVRRRLSAVEAAGGAGLAALALHNLVDFNLEIPGVAVPAVALLGALMARDSDRRLAPVWLPRWALFAGVAAAAALGLVEGVRGDMARDEERVREAARAGDDSRFVETLRAALSRHPADYLLPLLAAQREVRRGGSSGQGSPLPWVNRALFLFPGSYDAHLVAARWLARAGRDTQAVLEYRLALDARPAETEALLDEMVRRWPRFDVLREVARRRAARLLRWGLLATKLDRAPTRVEADRADLALLALDPRDHGALERRAWRAVAEGRDEEATARAESLAAVDFTQAARVRGTVLLRAGRAAEAAAELEQATARDPRDGEAWIDLARAASVLGDPRRALSAIGRARLLAAGGPSAVDVELQAGAILEGIGELAEALRAFEAAGLGGRVEAWQGVLRIGERLGRAKLVERARYEIQRRGAPSRAGGQP